MSSLLVSNFDESEQRCSLVITLFQDQHLSGNVTSAISQSIWRMDLLGLEIPSHSVYEDCSPEVSNHFPYYAGTSLLILAIIIAVVLAKFTKKRISALCRPRHRSVRPYQLLPREPSHPEDLTPHNPTSVYRGRHRPRS